MVAGKTSSNCSKLSLHQVYPVPRITRLSRRASLATHAFAQPHARYPTGGGGATYERVLRYPGGVERRIRYPLPEPLPCCDGIAAESAADGCEEWDTLNAWKGISTYAPSQSRPRQRRRVVGPRQAASAPAPPSEPLPQDTPSPPASPHEAIPASPLELLRLLNSPQRRRAMRAEWERVRGSYSILEGCPWPLPRPLYVLAAAHPDGDAGLTHTQRTRLPRGDLEDELTAVLGGRRRRGDGSPLIRCGEVVDGVVAFEDDADAERYGRWLEESGAGASGIAIARCDSHELFRGVRDARAVVVLLRRGAVVPRPHQLAAALRGQAPLDDDDD